jgi:hypothetical protein
VQGILGEGSQEDRVPGEGEMGFDNWNPVDQACHDREAANDDGVKLGGNVSNSSGGVVTPHTKVTTQQGHTHFGSAPTLCLCALLISVP